MRPIIKSNKHDVAGKPLEYKPWGKAKSDLIDEIGSFCSYCEKKVNRSSIHVEHIYANKVTDSTGALKYQHLQYRWDNFLLACCNCNSVKSKKDVALINPFLPHENNLIHFIEIGIGGTIKIKNGVTGYNLTKTINFIELGLDRCPGHINYSDKDDRWENRLEAVDLAKRQFNKYNSTPRQTDIENILCLAKEKGFFSVWYYQFLGHIEVLDALINGIIVNSVHIEGFKGTHSASFQPQNYTTVIRP